MKSQTLGVVVTTFNGSGHLHAQLDSVASQTRPPDEIVIADDASSDNSEAVIERFIASEKSNSRLLRAQRNLGLSPNLTRALAECRSDIILLSDQDDVWYASKSQRFLSALEANPRAFAAFSDARICDTHLRPMGFTLWQVEACGKHEQKCALDGEIIRLLAERNVVQGASLGFKTTLLPWILPIPVQLHTRLWCHDGWIAAIASAFGPVVPIQEALIDYRIHGANQVARYTRTNALRRFMPRVLRTLLRSLHQARNEGVSTSAIRLRDLRHQTLHLELVLERLHSQPPSTLTPNPNYVSLVQRLLLGRRSRLELSTRFVERAKALRMLVKSGAYRDELNPMALILRDLFDY